jgi:hypothetical protein
LAEWNAECFVCTVILGRRRGVVVGFPGKKRKSGDFSRVIPKNVPTCWGRDWGTRGGVGVGKKELPPVNITEFEFHEKNCHH